MALKVLYRSDYKRIAKDRAYFGDFDPLETSICYLVLLSKPKDCRNPHSLPATDIRHNQHQPVYPGLAAAADVHPGST